MKIKGVLAGLSSGILCALSVNGAEVSSLQFEVNFPKNLPSQDGRLFVVLSRTNNPEPGFQLGRSGVNAPQTWARDVKQPAPGAIVTLDQSAFGFPLTKMLDLPSGEYFIQAVFDSNKDLRSASAPGNLFSEVRKLKVDPAQGGTVALELTREVPPEELPADTELVKFVKIQSKLLSDFYGRPIFLRAGVILPRDYSREPSRHYPLWVRIGGLNTRYTAVSRLMEARMDFQKTWMAKDTPRFIVLQLDGAGPLGDPYQINSANDGPYGDAITQELIPQIEAKFRAIAKPHARVLSGTSTGGWVALALQVFYPDFFNGAWSSSPDPVDFRAFELANIYEESSLYINKFNNERPSERTLPGDVALLTRQEVGAENLLGAGNSYTRSGEQWGEWNAVFGPRGADGLPVPLWDPQTGKINHAVAEQWKKYDLCLVLKKDWHRLAPKLRGKIHISAGEADQYFLNNAVHLLDQYLHEADPSIEASINYGMGKAHGWSCLTLREMLEGMKAASEQGGH